MILGREIFRSHSITIISHANGSIQMCLKSNIKGVLKMHATVEGRSSNVDSSPFTKEQQEVPQKFCTNQKTAVTAPAIGSMVQKGDYLNALSVASKNLSPWIVDSGCHARRDMDQASPPRSRIMKKFSHT
ncbi:hypothetical protein DsansV1_C09g0093901 [Dioscorea sansibarensis]